jgi:hypothetical protein
MNPQNNETRKIQGEPITRPQIRFSLTPTTPSQIRKKLYKRILQKYLGWIKQPKKSKPARKVVMNTQKVARRN